MTAKRREWLAARLAGAGMLIVGLVLPAPAQQAGAKPPPRPVAVAEIVEQDIAAEQSFVGTVHPLRQSTVGSAVDGRVEQFSVTRGDFVRQGDVLAKLRTRTIEIEIAAAAAELKLRREELAELKNSWPKEIAQSEARLASAKSLMDYERSKLERTRKLHEQRIASEDDLQDATSAADRAQAAFQEAELALDLMGEEGPRKDQIAQADAKVEVQQEVINGLNDRLEKYAIVAPFDGYVISEYTEVGHWIKQGDQVAEIVDLSEVDVEALVLESFLPNVRLGMAAPIEAAALPVDYLEQLVADGVLSEPRLTGEVVAIVPNADVRSRNFPIQIRLQNYVVDGSPLLKPGMFARVTLPVGKQTARLAPKDAVVLGGTAGQYAVYVVDGAAEGANGGRTGTARLVPVTLGDAVGELVALEGEVEVGQLVVVAGNERLRQGQEISFQPPRAADGVAQDGAEAAESR